MMITYTSKIIPQGVKFLDDAITLKQYFTPPLSPQEEIKQLKRTLGKLTETMEVHTNTMAEFLMRKRRRKPNKHH